MSRKPQLNLNVFNTDTLNQGREHGKFSTTSAVNISIYHHVASGRRFSSLFFYSLMLDNQAWIRTRRTNRGNSCDLWNGDVNNKTLLSQVSWEEQVRDWEKRNEKGWKETWYPSTWMCQCSNALSFILVCCGHRTGSGWSMKTLPLIPRCFSNKINKKIQN